MTTNKVCYTEALGAAPCVRLGCGHLTHFHCARDKIEAGYSSTRISFAFMECALCREAMSHPALAEQLSPHQVTWCISYLVTRRRHRWRQQSFIVLKFFSPILSSPSLGACK